MEWNNLATGTDDFINSHFKKTNFWAAYSFCTIFNSDDDDDYCYRLGLPKDFFTFDFITLEKFINTNIKDVEKVYPGRFGFSDKYIEAVNYSRAFRFDIDKLHL
jgi:hypothetical protein